MRFENIKLGSNVDIDPRTSINNVLINDNVRIAKQCSIYGGPNNQMEIGENVYVGMHTILNGYAAKITIGRNTSISQYVNMMVDSGPNASPGMQQIYPIIKGPIAIGNDCWIGANANIMPNVTLGEFCVVASNSFVNKSYPAFSIVGGTPAKLIRTFTESEKAKMLSVGNSGLDEKSDYESNYQSLPFEDVLRQYRKKKLFEVLAQHSHKRILEIGCGSDPLFNDITDFEQMVVVEPAQSFFNQTELLVKGRDNITVIKGFIENIADRLLEYDFDFIVVGGFLHEITNTHEVMQAIRKVCSKKTIVYSIVPNAKSFHRLLAEKMGVIGSVYEKSGHDNLFDRQQVFDLQSYNQFFVNNQFEVIDSGSYFIKPFSHDQMNSMVEHQILDQLVFDGLDKMIAYLPELGAELFNTSRIDD